MARDYAKWAFYSLSAAEDANWEFTSPQTAEQEMLHHRKHLASEAVQLFLQCRWSAMSVAHANLMFNAIQSYKPETRLKYSLQQMWDGIAYVRNLYRTVSSNQSYSFEAVQHLAKQPTVPAAKVSKEGLTLQQFEQLMALMIKTGNDDLR